MLNSFMALVGGMMISQEMKMNLFNKTIKNSCSLSRRLSLPTQVLVAKPILLSRIMKGIGSKIFILKNQLSKMT